VEKLVLSIIIPVYNTEKYLQKCLDSILTQNVDFSLYEVICVNDGSKDNSLKILNEYKDKYNNVVVIDKENGGASSARNKGILYAKGKYLWFVDSDDYIKAKSLEAIISFLKEHTIDLLYFSLESQTPGDISIVKDSCGGIVGLAVTNIVLLDIIKSNNLFFYENIRYGEDTLFWYIVNLYVNDTYYIEKGAVYEYVAREDSIMGIKKGEKDYDKWISDYFFIINEFRRVLKLGIAKHNNWNQMLTFMSFCSHSIMYDSMPKSSYTYKQCVKLIKENKLIPTLKERFLGLKLKNIKGFKNKIKKLFVILFPLQHFKINYKKNRAK